jgi:hypothetical protein
MLPIVDIAVALRVVNHRYITLRSILSLVKERAKYQTMYIKMILIHPECRLQKNLWIAMVTNFCSDFR